MWNSEFLTSKGDVTESTVLELTCYTPKSNETGNGNHTIKVKEEKNPD